MSANANRDYPESVLTASEWWAGARDVSDIPSALAHNRGRHSAWLMIASDGAMARSTERGWTADALPDRANDPLGTRGTGRLD